MTVLLTESGARLVQETGFALVVDLVTVDVPWIPIEAGGLAWDAINPPAPTLWTSINPAGEAWVEITAR